MNALSILRRGRDEAGPVVVVEGVAIVDAAFFVGDAGGQTKPACGLIAEVEAEARIEIAPLLEPRGQVDDFAVVVAPAVGQSCDGGDLTGREPLSGKVQLIDGVVARGQLLESLQVVLVAQGEQALARVGIGVVEVADPTGIVALIEVVVLAILVADVPDQTAFPGEEPVHVEAVNVFGEAVIRLVDHVEVAILVLTIEPRCSRRQGVAGDWAVAQTDVVAEAVIVAFGEKELFIGLAGIKNPGHGRPTGVKPVIDREALVLGCTDVALQEVAIVRERDEVFLAVEREFAIQSRANGPQPLGVIVKGGEVEVIVGLVTIIDDRNLGDDTLKTEALVQTEINRCYTNAFGTTFQADGLGID